MPTASPRATANGRPAPRATPTPRPTPTPTPRRSLTPRPSPSATSSPLPAPTVTPRYAASTTAAAPPSPAAAPSSSRTVAASDDLARTPAEIQSAEEPRIWAALAVALLVLAGLGYVLWQWRLARRVRLANEEAARRPQVLVGGAVVPPPAVGASDATPALAPGGEVPTFWTPSRPADRDAPTGSVAPRAQPRLTIALHPRRAGLNLVSATADVELTVANEGEGETAEVAVALALLAGRAGQEEELGQLFAGDPPRPVVPPFALAPGETRVCRTTLVLPRDAIAPIAVGGRAMFVPVIAADVRYARGDGGTAQTAAAFVIGAPRAGTDKLSPFWLDAAPRMRDEVESRAHGLSVER